MAGIMFLALNKGTKEDIGNTTDKIALEGEEKITRNILLHNSLRLV